MTDDGVSRRRVLQGTAAVALGTALAGCEEDTNTYDYPFVPGDDLARDIHRYEDDEVTTQTTVEWTGTYVDHGPETRRYIAHPDGTDQTFDILDKQDDDVIRSVLGDMIDDDSHQDVPLQLYGQIDHIEGEVMTSDLDADDDYKNYVFEVEKAERLDTGQSTTNDMANTTAATENTGSNTNTTNTTETTGDRP